MGLQAGGEISLQDIEDEFGGTGEISINEYYGVDYFGGVPGSGTISFSDFFSTDVDDGNFNNRRTAIEYYDTESSGISDGGGFIYGSMGSANNGGQSVLYKGETVLQMYFDDIAGSFSNDNFTFEVSGEWPNSGWHELVINKGGYDLFRASATYTSGGGTTKWVWNVGNQQPWEQDPPNDNEEIWYIVE